MAVSASSAICCNRADTRNQDVGRCSTRKTPEATTFRRDHDSDWGAWRANRRGCSYGFGDGDVVCGLSAVTWCSRVIYAFRADNGLPASTLWRRVSRKHQTPAGNWLCVVVAFAAAVYSGAYSVVTSISVIALYFDI